MVIDIKTYGAILVALFLLELLYFRIADRYNIIDKPNQRSSHTRVVLRGGGIIFTIALWVWSIMSGFEYPWLLAGVSLAAGVSFIDDIKSLPDSIRLVVQILSMFLVFQEIGILQWDLWLLIPIALIVAVGGTNFFNFMDGINGITGGYSLAILIPLFLKNRSLDRLGMTVHPCHIDQAKARGEILRQRKNRPRKRGRFCFGSSNRIRRASRPPCRWRP